MSLTPGQLQERAISRSGTQIRSQYDVVFLPQTLAHGLIQPVHITPVRHTDDHPLPTGRGSSNRCSQDMGPVISRRHGEYCPMGSVQQWLEALIVLPLLTQGPPTGWRDWILTRFGLYPGVSRGDSQSEHICSGADIALGH
ncbi:MAG TPA: hypothetical protein PKW90_23265, partial [Myxococcota bacterium]|nr:hypothetical protein [Myxococcota bacterium]